MSHLKHSAADECVHLRTAELLEHAASLHEADIAVLAMQVVGMTHESIDFGSQQPWTPFNVLVAQMLFVLEQVIEDAVIWLALVKVGMIRLKIGTLYPRYEGARVSTLWFWCLTSKELIAR